MSNIVLIPGASSGIGKAAAQLFAQQGWNVVAKARSPEQVPALAQLDRIAVLRLDVTDTPTIHDAVETAS
ncbi:SDR family NAD(P)-dependent oxidoreductase [Cyanobacteria bacterium FACHB-472]|nr:SDR family NAD(P)-dependent oxidoreductase [Cyanobacteria bacterium FACHB-472]